MFDFTSNQYGLIVIILAIMLFATLSSIAIGIYKKQDQAQLEESQAKFEALQDQLEALQDQLSQSGIREIDQMDGFEFEGYLVALFKKIGIQAIRTPSTNDFGADLILEGKKRVVVQSKRYQGKVGIKAVQEINSARNYYMAQEAWVITNSFFTPQAVKLAESTDVKLIDRDELVDIILNANTISLDIK